MFGLCEVWFLFFLFFYCIFSFSIRFSYNSAQQLILPGLSANTVKKKQPWWKMNLVSAKRSSRNQDFLSSTLAKQNKLNCKNKRRLAWSNMNVIFAPWSLENGHKEIFCQPGEILPIDHFLRNGEKLIFETKSVFPGRSKIYPKCIKKSLASGCRENLFAWSTREVCLHDACHVAGSLKKFDRKIIISL